MADNKEMALLKPAVEEFEADIIEALLTSSGIPVFRKSRFGGDYMVILSGINRSGIDIYVPAELLEEAESILKAEHCDPTDTEYARNAADADDDSSTDAERAFSQYRHRWTMGRIIVVFFIITGIISITYNTVKWIALFF